MIKHLRAEISALSPAQQVLCLLALLLSLVLALVVVWACRKYNSRRNRWRGAP